MVKMFSYCNRIYFRAIAVLPLFSFSVSVFSQNIDFQKLTTKQGLSHSTVYDIAQDGNGFIWIATREGLNRYDSYDIKTYYRDSLTHSGLASNQINSLLAIENKLYIGTDSGLSEYIPEKDSFKELTDGDFKNKHINMLFEATDGAAYVGTTKGLYKVSPNGRIENVIPDVGVLAICKYKSNVYWVALNHRILLINNLGEIIKQYELPLRAGSSKIKATPVVHCLFKDSADDIWLGTLNGLFRFNQEKDIFEPSDIFKKFNTLEANVVRAIAEDENKNLWFGTESGVFVYDKSNNKSEHYGQSFHNSGNSLSDKAVYSLFVSKENIVWIGTYFGGVNYTKSNKNGFYTLIPDNFNKSVSGKAISQIIQDGKGNLWIGTEDGGITIFNRKFRSFRYLSHKNGIANTLSSNNLHSLHEDHKGSIWIGTFLGGLNRYDERSGKITVYKNEPGDSTSLSNNNVYSILQDKDKRLWIGTQYGLNLYHYNNESFSRFEPAIFGNKFIYDILEDSQGDLWFCTRNSGIYRLENHSKNIIHYSAGNYRKNGLTSNEIISAYEDQKGQLWFGSLNGGLLKWDNETQTFGAIVQGQGLPNNNVYGILQDPVEGYWITTNKGLTLLNPITLQSRTFTTSDGLSDNQFNFKSFFKDDEGWLYFGSVNGLTYFKPDSLSIRNPVPKIYFKNLKLFNKEVGVGKKSPLTSAIDRTDSLILTHDQNAITFEYAAINFHSGGNNSYAHYLEGFESDWNFVGNDRTAAYTNLSPGEYIFHVKTVHNDTSDTAAAEHRQIHLSILPPFWQTNWAFALYALLGLMGIYAYYRFAKFIRQKNLAIELEKVEKEKINEINRHRLNFFTFISHEFKTPITLIIASVEKFFQKSPSNGNIPDEFLSVKRSAGKLHHLVQQLMQFRKIETDHARLELYKGDIVLFLKDTFEAFRPLFEYKGQTYVFGTNYDSYYCHFDADKFEMILTNLVSNAIKNTDEQGEIKLNIQIFPPKNEDSNAFITLELTDTGNGLDEQEHETIFTPFYTNSQKDNPKTGTGIGLALVKSLVDFLDGNLLFESFPEKGTNCKIHLPLLMEDHSMEAEVKTIMGNKSLSLPIDMFLEKDLSVNQETPIVLPKEMTLLIAEDNQELMKLLSKHFSNKYKVIMAKDGKDALAKLHNKKPDIIVSDIKMPVMDGLTLCKEVKTNSNTSHIPFLLLTGQTHQTSKLEGLSVGANAYMSKPFHLEELDLLVRNLLESSKNLENRFSGLLSSESNTLPKSNNEREFLLQITSLVENNHTNSDFTIGKLANMAGISRSLLHIKMKKITGLSASEFIKRTKMEKASSLLKKGYPISEVAYKVGYNDPNYFSRVFKKQRGTTPSAYSQKERAANRTN